MHTKQLEVSRGEYVLRRRRGSNHVLKTVNGAALHVHAEKHRSSNGGLARAQQLPSLFRLGNVAGKQNHARRL